MMSFSGRKVVAMHVFIDESGSFTGFHEGSISAVRTLAVPTAKLDVLKKKYGKIRARLPREKGEVTGRLLNEEQMHGEWAWPDRPSVLPR